MLEVVRVVPEVVESPEKSDFSSSLQPVATAAPAQSTAGAQTTKRSEASRKIAGSEFKGGSSKDESTRASLGDGSGILVRRQLVPGAPNIIRGASSFSGALRPFWIAKPPQPSRVCARGRFFVGVAFELGVDRLLADTGLINARGST